MSYAFLQIVLSLGVVDFRIIMQVSVMWIRELFHLVCYALAAILM